MGHNEQAITVFGFFNARMSDYGCLFAKAGRGASSVLAAAATWLR